MTASRKFTAGLTALTAVGLAWFSTGAINAAVTTTVSRYEPITAQEVKDDATTVFTNAKEAGRLQAADVQRFQTQLNAAYTLPDVESAWANVEATAQVAKNRHVSLDSLLQEFQTRLNTLQAKGIVPPEGWKFYSDRLMGIRRIQKQLKTADKNHVWLFWDWASLAIDLSSVQERLTRALDPTNPELETFDDLILRTDNYMQRNDVAARGLTTYKSFEVEPEELQSAKHTMYTVLLDRAHSRLETPEVKRQLIARLKTIHYEAARVLPAETDIDKAIVEVQRLLDAGARNGHLSALDNVRIHHELELIKRLKTAYPGPNAGIDPIEKELRMEEVRFMSLDLRFLQDWLGRLLRADGETLVAREQVLRTLRRTDLALFSHRITHKDALGIIQQINTVIRDAKNDTQIAVGAEALEGKLDMMISDFSMQPADVSLRVAAVAQDVARLRDGRDDATRDFEHAQRLAEVVRSMPEGPQKYGQSIVAATELEMIRHKLEPVLQRQR
jgi:hypothetical protein